MSKNIEKRKYRVRNKIRKNRDRKRLSVYISNAHVYVQLIDDNIEKTIVSSSSLQFKAKGVNVTMAKKVGKDIAEKAKKLKIIEVVFDRGARLYHGKIKALADSARENGLKF